MCAEGCLHELTVGLGLLQSGETLLPDKQRHIHKLTKKAQRKKKGKYQILETQSGCVVYNQTQDLQMATKTIHVIAEC